MVDDGEYIAVLDRFESSGESGSEGDDDESTNEYAVLLLEQDGDLVNQLIVESTALPEPGRKQDAILQVRIENEELLDATYKAETTERRMKHAQSHFDRLAQRPPDDYPEE